MPHFLDRCGNDLRQTLPAKFRILGEPVPAVFDVLPIRVLESSRRFYAAVGLKRRTFAIPRDVQRIEDIRRELGGLVENGRWIEPPGLKSEPNFKGYVVFLLPSRSSTK